jgi:hypothetical protein
LIEIKGEDYSVIYKPKAQTVTLTGIIRLPANDYNDIVNVLDQVAGQRTNMVTLDTRQLEFLNSSGINHLLQFAIKLRQQKPATQLLVKGSNQIPWQQYSLKNLRTVNKNVELVWESS